VVRFHSSDGLREPVHYRRRRRCREGGCRCRLKGAEIEQLAFAESELLQVLSERVCWIAPVIEIPEMARADEPVFVSVTVLRRWLSRNWQ